MPGHRLDVPTVPLEDALLRLGCEIPNSDGGIVAAGGKLGVRGTEGETVDRLLVVRVDRRHGGDGGAPVLDVAPGIGR